MFCCAVGSFCYSPSFHWFYFCFQQLLTSLLWHRKQTDTLTNLYQRLKDFMVKMNGCDCVVCLKHMAYNSLARLYLCINVCQCVLFSVMHPSHLNNMSTCPGAGNYGRYSFSVAKRVFPFSSCVPKTKQIEIKWKKIPSPATSYS